MKLQRQKIRYNTNIVFCLNKFFPKCVTITDYLFSCNYRADLGPESVIQISAVTSIVGAWIGAFPIPLDWDRDWQVLVALCYKCIKLSVLKINKEISE